MKQEFHEKDIQSWLDINRNLYSEINVLKGILQQAHLTIGLLNDTLRNKGDNSHNEWVNHITLQIQRTINPVYFVETPEISTNTKRRIRLNNDEENK